MDNGNGALKTAPVIIKKKVVAHGGHHGGAWKVAYADFVTAMMALFIVLWLMSSSEKVQKAVGGYFSDPRGTGKLAGTTKAGASEPFVLKREDMAELKKRIERTMASEIRDFNKLKEFVQMTVTEEGLRIELLESEKGMFFESGKAMPTAEGSQMIAMLAGQLGQLPNAVVIEGHTDSKPLVAAGGAYTNWELSADRANTVRRFMHEHGLRSDQIAQVRGFADQYLRKADDPQHPSNRRVSVIVKFRDARKGEQHGQGEAAAPVAPGAAVAAAHH